METWLSWAKGPVFLFAFMFMILGLIRHLVLTVFEIKRAMARAGDKSLPSKMILKWTLKWLIPIETIRNRFIFSVTSLVFHVAIIIVPLFLAGHIALWTRGLGISWPAISNSTADLFTIIAIIAAIALVVQRCAARATRALSRFQDYLLPLLIAVPFASGFLAMHPVFNPFSFNATMLVHVMSANIIFILIPLTKLTHMVLVPGVQLISEIAWHWPPDSGTKVCTVLGKEGDPI